ncbi:MAG: SHOCT domain-containing protein, partial [Solirubrobacterales bacterium]
AREIPSLINRVPQQRLESSHVLHANLSFLLLADTWGMHDNDVGTGWMVVMMLGMVLFWGLVILGSVWVLRDVIGRGHHGTGGDPVAILDRRLAEGEISVKEYEQRKKILVTSPRATR